MTIPDVSQEAVEALADQWEHRSYEVSSMLRALSRANEELRERAEKADRMYAETNSALMRSGRLVGEKAADVILFTERVEKYKNALRTIKQWDCLNPPRADLLGDLPWLRGIVDAALASQEENP